MLGFGRVLAVSALAVATLAVLAVGGASAAQVAPSPGDAAAVVTREVAHDVSPPLRAITPILPNPAIGRVKPLLPTVPPPAGEPEGALQSAPIPPALATTATAFPGLGVGLTDSNGNVVTQDAWIPPDTNGAAGASQYVQVVNQEFGVFDKTNGSLLYPPSIDMAAGLNTLWSNFVFDGPSGPDSYCEKYGYGDPIVVYDQMAQRWIFTQFAFNSDLGTAPFVAKPPYYQCFAVSDGSDAATSSYYRYAFSFSTFPDYPKLGVWPDAYYYSANGYNRLVSFSGAIACAFDRASMLNGAAATAQCFYLSKKVASLLPSTLDGSTLPPAGAPNYFLGLAKGALSLWRFHVDFANPVNTSFTGPSSLPVASYTPACNGGSCIPQKGTSQLLDSLGDRLMYRLAYRNFVNDHEALVVNHSVSAAGSVGVRWYELRKSTGDWGVFQQGTYAPDANFRWMGSIAMDAVGNIALGYSESSSAIYPRIAFAARAPIDGLGALEPEMVITYGGGSQTGYDRWGDYSSMSIDPVDDCTLWYTNEYLPATGSFNWSTTIAHFTLPGCPAP
jgi:hypothetical protein